MLAPYVAAACLVACLISALIFYIVGKMGKPNKLTVTAQIAKVFFSLSIDATSDSKKQMIDGDGDSHHDPR